MLDHLLWAAIGAVIAVTVPKVGTFIHTKVTQAEAKAKAEIAKVPPGASAELKAEVDKVVALAESEAEKVL